MSLLTKTLLLFSCIYFGYCLFETIADWYAVNFKIDWQPNGYQKTNRA